MTEKNGTSGNPITYSIKILGSIILATHRNWRVVILMYSLIIVSIVFAGPQIVSFSKGMTETIYGKRNVDELANAMFEARRKYDSIEKAVLIEEARRTSRGLDQIKDQALKLKSTIPNCKSITYWVVKDHGLTLMVTNTWFVRVLYSTDVDIRYDWEEYRLMYPGFRDFARVVEAEGTHYVPDLANDSTLGRTKTNEYIESIGKAKSTVCALVANNGTTWHFISISFVVTNGIPEENDIYRKLDDFRIFVKERI